MTTNQLYWEVELEFGANERTLGWTHVNVLNLHSLLLAVLVRCHKRLRVMQKCASVREFLVAHVSVECMSRTCITYAHFAPYLAYADRSDDRDGTLFVAAGFTPSLCDFHLPCNQTSTDATGKEAAVV